VCIFNQLASERPSYTVVWIVGAVIVAVTVVAILVVLL
jgi:hypothetical protein